MTIDKARKIKVGDRVHPRDFNSFVVDKIEIKHDAAYMHEFIYFSGTTDKGIRVAYDHKKLV